MNEYAAFYTDEFMREHREMLAALARGQRPCPHCGQPMEASTPAGAVEKLQPSEQPQEAK